MKIMKPFKDSKQFWLGDEEGQMRKVYHCLGKEISESVHFNVGITVYDPGESSDNITHTKSEKIVYIISGNCTIHQVENNEKVTGKSGDIMYFEMGETHRFSNEYDEQLKILWFMTSDETQIA